MRDRPLVNMSLLGPEPGRPGDAQDLLDQTKIFRRWDETGRAGDDDYDTVRVPGITSLPEGIEVVEQSLGRADGQWVLVVRCQCGKRWFEVEAIDTATCPRCGLLVLLQIAPGGPGDRE